MGEDTLFTYLQYWTRHQVNRETEEFMKSHDDEINGRSEKLWKQETAIREAAHTINKKLASVKLRAEHAEHSARYHSEETFRLRTQVDQLRQQQKPLEEDAAKYRNIKTLLTT